MGRADEVLDIAQDVALRIPALGYASTQPHEHSLIRIRIAGGINARAAIQLVDARTADQRVVACTADQRVIVVAAVKHVVAAVALQRIGIALPGQGVGVGRAAHAPDIVQHITLGIPACVLARGQVHVDGSG